MMTSALRSTQPTLAVIGVGKVGETLARLYFMRGWSIKAVSSRNSTNATRLAKLLHARVTSPAEAIAAADLTLIAVPDDAILGLAQQAASQVGNLAGKAVIHTSGALDARVLTALHERGAATGSFHPAYPFADVERAINGLVGATFAIEANDEKLRAWLIDMAHVMAGRVLQIPTGKKALYHAALSIASNYTVTLIAVAEQLLLEMGADKIAADNALSQLLAGTVENVRAKGIPDALTGPLVRGDVGTLQAHLRALHEADESVAALYHMLALASYPMLKVRGTPTEKLDRFFKQDEAHDTADST